MKLAPQSGVQVTLLLDEQPDPHAKSQRNAVACQPAGHAVHDVNVPAFGAQLKLL